eukprot:1194914-Prorocentrum_minimum.AAC.3
MDVWLHGRPLLAGSTLLLGDVSGHRPIRGCLVPSRGGHSQVNLTSLLINKLLTRGDAQLYDQAAPPLPPTSRNSVLCFHFSRHAPLAQVGLLLGLRLVCPPVELLLNRLPEDREHHRLADVRQEARLQPTPKEPGEPVLLDHALDGSDVAKVGVAARLLQRLNHAQRVGDCVRHGRGADADRSVTRQLHLALRLGNLGLKEVEGDEPRVVPDPVGSKVGASTIVQHANAALGNLLLQHGECGVALHLESGLKGVDRGKENTPGGTTSGGKCRHSRDGHVGVEGLESSEHSGVGRGVTETRQRVLNYGEAHTLVKTFDTTLLRAIGKPLVSNIITMASSLPKARRPKFRPKQHKRNR